MHNVVLFNFQNVTLQQIATIAGWKANHDHTIPNLHYG